MLMIVDDLQSARWLPRTQVMWVCC